MTVFNFILSVHYAPIYLRLFIQSCTFNVNSEKYQEQRCIKVARDTLGSSLWFFLKRMYEVQ